MKRRDFVLGAAALAALSRAGAASGGVAVVLGGGGCRGYGHIGVIRVLEANGLKPDLVVGSSVGSLVGALYASGMRAEELERHGERVNPNLLRDWIFPKLGLFGGEGIARFVRERVKAPDIESLPLRFAAVATDLRSGEAVILERGDLGRAVQASSSAPGLLEPVTLAGRLLVDGNLAAPVPVAAARRLGARKVIAVDVTFPPLEADLADPFDALYQAFSILTRRLALEERSRADLVLEPRLQGHPEHMSRAMIRAMTEAGERAALEALPKLRALFGY
jgi:NTE family protein